MKSIAVPEERSYGSHHTWKTATHRSQTIHKLVCSRVEENKAFNEELVVMIHLSKQIKPFT